MKRIFDILASSIIILIFFPFGIIISLLIFFTSKGGVFFIQQRIGKNQKEFGLVKFRTMKSYSEKEGSLTVGKDSRITKVGSFLRQYKLDEFPQFLNVLFGQMSIVGPRPEVEEFVDLYTEEQLEILKVKPGITDLASLEYFDENAILGKTDNPRKVYIEEIMPAKIKLNKKYLDDPTIINDLKIMWRTFVKIIA
tara:strand:- start:10473 stop:11057 length:585 start_codon:yes stop_codon:yes gene_type:complete